MKNFVLLCMVAALTVATDKPPAISDADRAKIREFQLADTRIADKIKGLQLQIVTLQQQQAQNVEAFQKFVATVCKDDKYEFDMNSDDPLRCIEKKKPEVKVDRPATK